MTKAVIRALDEEFDSNDYKSHHAHSKAFYDRFSQARKNVPQSDKLAGYLQGNSFVHWFLATELYSIIQHSEFVKDSEKSLFIQPVVTKQGLNDMPLNDPQMSPFYSMNYIKTKTSGIDDDDYEEFDDVA